MSLSGDCMAPAWCHMLICTMLAYFASLLAILPNYPRQAYRVDQGRTVVHCSVGSRGVWDLALRLDHVARLSAEAYSLPMSLQ